MSLNIALASDLHLELSSGDVPIPAFAEDADVIVLAGDITNRYQRTRNRFAQVFAAFRAQYSQPILFVPGNHEYYGSDLTTLNRDLPDLCAAHNITLLQQSWIDLGNVRFFGCTLWSNFLLNGAEEMPWAIQRAQGRLADYRAIQLNGRLMEAIDTRALFHNDMEWLRNELDQTPAGQKKVICTHFAPDKGCISPGYVGDDLNAYFVNDLTGFIHSHSPDAWLCGHTHYNVDYRVGTTRIVSNQLGYAREQTGFQPRLLVTIE